MKQHITKEQWDELTKEQKAKFFDETDVDWANCLRSYPEGIVECAEDWRWPSIGQMIEFLGENMYQINLGTNGLAWAMLTKEGKQITAYELCDALWEAVKHKLNHPQEDV